MRMRTKLKLKLKNDLENLKKNGFFRKKKFEIFFFLGAMGCCQSSPKERELTKREVTKNNI